MLSAYFDPGGRRCRALRDGPSGALFEGFAHALRHTGYPTTTARRHFGAAEHFLHWITGRRWSSAELSERSLARFDHHLARCRCRYRRANRTNVVYGARLFVQTLREAGLIGTPAMNDGVQDPALLRAFCRWVREQRGTCETTLSNYAWPIRALLARLGEEPSRFDARGMRSFVLRAGAVCRAARAAAV